MQASYADLLRDLLGQYHSGRMTFEHFRRARYALLSEAEAQYQHLAMPLAPPPRADDEDITAIQYPSGD